MKQTYLEVTYRHGRATAGYLYLPCKEGEASVRTSKAGNGILVDFAADGRPIGIEITSPSQVASRALNAVLASLGLPPVGPAELAPACAA